MQVTINGQPQTLEGELSLADLLAARKLEPVRVAVEVNEELVPRGSFADAVVRDGDRIEIVTFVGGG